MKKTQTNSMQFLHRNRGSMKTSLIPALVMFLALASLVLQSCNLLAPMEARQTTLSLQLSGTSRGTSMPVLQASDITSYDVVLDNGTQSQSRAGVSDLSTPFAISSGTWNLTITAKDSGGNSIGTLWDPASQSTTQTIVLGGGENMVPVIIIPDLVRNGGAGSVDILVSWTAPSPVTALTVTWKAWDPVARDFLAGTDLNTAQAIPDLSGKNVHLQMTGVASGDYIAVFKLGSAFGTYNNVSQLVKVYDNLVTRDTLAITQAQLTQAPDAPLGLAVERVSRDPNNDGAPVEMYLSWNPPTTGNTMGYRVYAGGSLVGTITNPGYGTEYWTWAGGGGVDKTLQIKAYNAAGESPAVSFNYVALEEVVLTNLAMRTGETHGPTLTITPSNANPVLLPYSWTSDNIAVASVDYSTGLVSAVGVGTATISVLSTLDEDNDKVNDTLSFEVTVTQAPPALVGQWNFENPPYQTNETGVAEVAMGPAPQPSSPGYASASGIMFSGAAGPPVITASSPYDTLTAPWTLSMWVKPDSGHSGSSESLLCYGNGNTFKLKQFAQSDQVGITIYNQGDYVFAGATVPEGVWSHVAFVNDGSTVTLYIDGVNKGSLSQASVVALPLPQGILGELSTDGGTTLSDHYYGGMDQLMIHTVALDAAGVSALAGSGFAGGKGTSASPWTVDTLARLNMVRYDLSAWYVQTASIAADSSLLPIGDDMTAFSGHYDGGGYTVSGLALTPASTDSAGLFGYTMAATISNLTVSGTITCNNTSNSGMLVGSSNDTTITNCHSSGSIGGLATIDGNLGGLVGRLAGGKVSQSSSDVNISVGEYVGGLAGFVTGGTMTVDTYYGTVIEKSWATGTVTGTVDMATVQSSGGGLAGIIFDGSGSNYYDRVLISQSYANGSVSASQYAGGFAGSINNQYQVSGVTIANCYSTGSSYLDTASTAGSYSGGFVGFVSGSSNTANINYSYAGGGTGTENLGVLSGFIGGSSGSMPQLTSCIYNTDKGGTDANVNVTPATTAQMMTMSYFTGLGFDMDTSVSATSTKWIIQEGQSQPYLRWQGVVNVPNNPFALRDYGPGGGYVFYDKGVYSSGWRYMVAAPGDIQGSTDQVNPDWYPPMAQGAQNGVDVISTGSAVGDGYANTAAIAAVRTAAGNVLTAAQACDIYSPTVAGINYSNWALPSIGELDLLYSVLYYNGYGGFFSNVKYWSSTDTEDDDCTWAKDFTDGSNASAGINWHSNGGRVRPVMQF